jgi:zinc finger protein
MSQQEDLTVKCPSCGNGNLKITSMLYSIPFFNELAMFSMECPECGFKHNDIFSTEQRPPSRWSLVVDDQSLLSVRVVRSSSGTIRIPEYGIDVEPGPFAESFISNVEGVLFRIRSVVETAIAFADTDGQRQRGEEILDGLDKVMQGEQTITLIIEDPAGISAILPEDKRRVKHIELSTEEASKLKGAPMWLDFVREEYSEHKG